MRAVKPAEADHAPVAAASTATTGDHLKPLMQQAEATSRQLQQLTEAVNKLVQQTAAQHAPTAVVAPPPLQGTPPPPPAMLSANAPAFHSEGKGNQVPRKPCPRCKEHGYWGRQCPTLPSTNGTGYQTAVKPQQAGVGAARRPCLLPTSVKAPSVGLAARSAAYIQARVDGRYRRCLLDTVADVSLIPAQMVPPSKLTLNEQRLSAANSTPILVTGLSELPLTIKNGCTRLPSMLALT